MFSYSGVPASEVLISLDYRTWYNAYRLRHPGSNGGSNDPKWMTFLRDCAGKVVSKMPSFPGRQLRASFAFSDHTGQVWEGSIVRMNDKFRSTVMYLFPRQVFGGEDERRLQYVIRDEVIELFDSKTLVRQWERTVNNNWVMVLTTQTVKISVDEAPTRIGAYIHQFYITMDEHVTDATLRRRLIKAMQYITKHLGTDTPLPQSWWGSYFPMIKNLIIDGNPLAVNQIGCLMDQSDEIKRFMAKMEEVA